MKHIYWSTVDLHLNFVFQENDLSEPPNSSYFHREFSKYSSFNTKAVYIYFNDYKWANINSVASCPGYLFFINFLLDQLPKTLYGPAKWLKTVDHAQVENELWTETEV